MAEGAFDQHFINIDMKKIIWSFLLLILCSSLLLAQPELYPWGNMTGIRLDGEIMELNTSLNLVGTSWSDVKKTEKEIGSYQYRRVGNTQFNSISLNHFIFEQSVEALGAGRANVRIQFRSEADTFLRPGDYFQSKSS